MFRNLFLFAAVSVAAFGGEVATIRDTPVSQTRATILSTSVLCKEPGRYIGWPTVCRRRNGELIAIFSGDRDEHVCPWGKVQIVRSGDDGKTWSAPETIRNSVADDRDAGIVELADGTLLANWFTSLAWQNLPTWSRSAYTPESRTPVAEYMRHLEKLPKEYLREAIGYWTMRSTDGGRTWEKPVRTTGTRPHNVTQLKDGRILAVGLNYPSADHKISSDPGFKDLTHDPICEESTDGGRSWHVLSKFPVAAGIVVTGLHEPHLTECADGRLVAMYRYHAKDVGDGVSLQSESADGGRTWTPLHRCGINGYPPHLTTLKDGRLLCVYGKRTAGNYGEWACFSDDGGKTWDTANEVLLCRHWNGDLGYPASVEMPDGTIFTVYYQADRQGEKTCLMGTRWRPSGTPDKNVSGKPPKKLAPFFYEYVCDDYSPEKALKLLEKGIAPKTVGGCSGFRCGDFHGRNLDWSIDATDYYFVRTPEKAERHATIGIAMDFANGDLDVIPLGMMDGINSKGVVVEVNVVPAGDLGITTSTRPGAQRMGTMMVTRHLLDHADSAAHAVALFDTLDLFGDGQHEMHWMISDLKETYVVEIVSNAVRAIKHPIMTNFYVTESPYVKPNGTFTPGSAGIERYERLKTHLGRVDSVDAMLAAMKEEWYTRVYVPGHDLEWWSESNGSEWTDPDTGRKWSFIYEPGDKEDPTRASHVARRKFIREQQRKFAEMRAAERATGVRKTTEFWQTVDSGCYDIRNRRLSIRMQESDPLFVFSL